VTYAALLPVRILNKGSRGCKFQEALFTNAYSYNIWQSTAIVGVQSISKRGYSCIVDGAGGRGG